ncbi:lactonase family protein [Ekhidna sp.]
MKLTLLLFFVFPSIAFSQLKLIELHTVDDIAELYGGRSIKMSPDGKKLFVLARLTDVITVFDRNTESGSLIQKQTLSLPCSSLQLELSKDGKSLYTICQSGSLLAYRIDESGFLESIGIFDCKRSHLSETNGMEYLSLSADDQFLYVPGSFSEAISTFRRNASTGELSLIDTRSHTKGKFNDWDWGNNIAFSANNKSAYFTSPRKNLMISFNFLENGDLQFQKVIKKGMGVDDGEPDKILISKKNPFIYVYSISLGVSIYRAQSDKDLKYVRNLPYYTESIILNEYEDQMYMIYGASLYRTIVTLDIDPGNSELTLNSEYTGESDSRVSDDQLIFRDMVLSPDGQHLYVVGENGLLVFRT